MTIPKSVTNIDQYAFFSCSGMTMFSVDPANPFYTSKEGLLCSKAGSILFFGVKGDVTIPYGVKVVKRNAFGGGLRSVIIPQSVTNIEHGAFSFPWRLTSFSVDAGNPVFCSRNGLLCSKDGETILRGVGGNVIIPSGVKNVGSGAFWGCARLRSVEMSPSVKYIGANAFWQCDGLTSVTIPLGVTNVEWNAFARCAGLKSVVIVGGDVRIGRYAFGGCGKLVNVQMPASIANVDCRAFSECGELKTIEIVEDGRSIPMAFDDFCNRWKLKQPKDIKRNRTKKLPKVDSSGRTTYRDAQGRLQGTKK